MYVYEVYSLFWEYTDEEDQTFLKPSQVQRYLRSGYDEFRRICANYDPNLFVAHATITLSGVSQYDLSAPGNPVRLLGAAPTQAPMQRLTQIVSVNPSDGRIQSVWAGVKTEDELSYGQSTYKYLLQGQTVYFGSATTDTIKLIYVPQGSKPRNPVGVDWSKILSADTEFIDDLDEFHDVIALMAYQQYAIRDNADNNPLLRLLERRIQQLQQYLFNGRDSNAASHSSHSY